MTLPLTPEERARLRERIRNMAVETHASASVATGGGSMREMLRSWAQTSLDSVRLADYCDALEKERAELREWLWERAQPFASSDYLFRHLNKEDGVTYTPYRVMLAKLDELAAGLIREDDPTGGDR